MVRLGIVYTPDRPEGIAAFARLAETAYHAGIYTQLHEALRTWLAAAFPFWNPHYSNRELPDT